MKIDLETIIRDLHGAAVLNEAGAPVILRELVQGALLASLPEDKNIDGVEKAKMFALALKCNSALAELSVEDISLIKRRIGQTLTPLAVGRSYEILDPVAK